MDQLAPKLPPRYAPLQLNGHGLQSVYLTRLPESFALELVELIGIEARNLLLGRRVDDAPLLLPGAGLIEWERHQLQQIEHDPGLGETTRTALVQARRGQGVFKQRVLSIEQRCRLTGVDRLEHLIASHCKPWRDASNEERLDGENGLLLTPDADHLFDRGFISFDDRGSLLVSPVAHVPSLVRMGIDPTVLKCVGAFSAGQRRYLDFHRENVFLEARLAR
jgi:hypothetical protein